MGGTPSATGGTPPGVGGTPVGLGGAPAATGGTPGTVDPGAAFDYVNQDVKLDADLVIPSGKTVRVGPGVKFTAAANVNIRVQGTLIVDATQASPAQFVGAGTVSSWGGIIVESGGNLQMKYATIRDGKYGIHTLKGSTYSVDRADIGGSFKAAVLESDGTIDHTYFRASPPTSIAITEEVSIDDPNGTMTILDASPTVTNSRFEGASGFTDMVRVGGKSSPVFDHDYFRNAHCGFHNFGAVNNTPKVTSSVFEQLSYGVMAFQSKPSFENCSFLNNANDVGYCYGATADNVPTLKGNYYSSGTATIDAPCFQIGTADATTAAAPIAGAGPVGL
jgi:nitrous oxidase accessory protein NosD